MSYQSFSQLKLQSKVLVGLQVLVLLFGLFSNALVLLDEYLLTTNPLIPEGAWMNILVRPIVFLLFYLLMIVYTLNHYKKYKGQHFGKLILITLGIDLAIAILV